MEVKHMRSSRFAIATVIVPVVAALILLFLFDPKQSPIFPPCPFYALTGLYCPGCGSGRGLHELLHGHVIAALGFNPLMVILLPFVAYSLVSGALRNAAGFHLPTVKTPAYSGWILLGVITVYWILRNLPTYPFTLLAP